MRKLCILACALFCLSACQPATPLPPTVQPIEATLHPTPTSSHTPTNTPTHTATAIPTATSTITPTHTATPIPTDTPTIAPTPTATHTPTVTRTYNTPGIYDFEDKCIRIYVKEAYGDECLWSVEVRADGRMQFNFRWSALHVRGTGADFLIKYTDEGNRNMYITDNLGNRYDHVEIGGAARGEYRIYEGQSVEGWFLFEPARSGATAFTFHDDDQRKTFDGIVLLR